MELCDSDKSGGPLKVGKASDSKICKSLLSEGMLIPSPFESGLEFCFFKLTEVDTSFSSVVIFYMFVHSLDTLNIPVHHLGTGDIMEKLICNFACYFSKLRLFFCFMQFVHESDSLNILNLSPH